MLTPCVCERERAVRLHIPKMGLYIIFLCAQGLPLCATAPNLTLRSVFGVTPHVAISVCVLQGDGADTWLMYQR